MRRDYKLFRTDLRFAENAAERKVWVVVPPQTRAAVVDIGRLLQEGYVVRDLFWADAAHCSWSGRVKGAGVARPREVEWITSSGKRNSTTGRPSSASSRCRRGA